MLFFLCFSPTIKFQDGSPVDPLFEPPADPPFGVDLSKNIFIVISASLRGRGPSRKRACFLEGAAWNVQGQRRYPKELVRQSFCRTFGWTFWCDLPQNRYWLLGSALELFRKFFGAARAILWLWGSFWALEMFMARLPFQHK